MCRKRARFARQPQRDDQITGLKRAFSRRRIAGETMQGFDRDLAPAGSALNLHDSVEGDQRHTEIRRVGGNAGLAPAEHGVQSVLAVTGIASRARFALVAGAGDIVEISASRPLQEIAADGCGVAKLCGGARQQCLGNRRIEAGEIRIVREIGVANQRADADAAIGQTFDPVEPRQARDVDETVRTRDSTLHQVEQVGATRKIGGARFGGGRDGLGDRCGSDIIEGLHADRLWLASTRLFCTSSTASVIPE